MFADLHHLHQFVSLEHGGSVTASSWAGGTGAGEANIYFGEARLTTCAVMLCALGCVVS